MTKDAYLEIVFPIQCRGRNASTEEVFSEPVAVKVRVTQLLGDEKNISLRVEECPYNVGGYGDLCKVSHPGGALCPYIADVPHVSDRLTLYRAEHFHHLQKQ